MKVNGRDYSIEVEARKTLADVLREDCGLTGTNVGCEHGVCGACTVLIDGAPARSCLTFAVQWEGVEITTVESLAADGEMSRLQQAFIDHHALQCGFCTPGFLMLITGALKENPRPTDEEVTDLLSSNLCRCTGYQNIKRAVKAYIADTPAG